MVTYPHHLFRIVSPSAYQDEHGAFVSGGSTTKEYLGVCRYEVDGKGTQIYVGDDKHVVSTGVIYTPTTQRKFGSGECVMVAKDREGNDVVCNANVVSVDNGRLHNRIWTR